jgi:Domain of unknown function (DUF1707)
MAEETNHYSRRTPADRALRASDADRTAVGDILRKEHVAGRLDTDEFAERFGRCLEAKTYAQLDVLLADLPEGAETAFTAGPAPLRATAWQGGPWYERRRPWRVPAMAWLVLVGLLVALSAGPALWVLVPLVFLFVVRPLMWRSAGRPGWGRRGGCGSGAYGTWL